MVCKVLGVRTHEPSQSESEKLSSQCPTFRIVQQVRRSKVLRDRSVPNMTPHSELSVGDPLAPSRCARRGWLR